MIRFVSMLFTLGLCAVSVRAAAEPRTVKPAPRTDQGYAAPVRNAPSEQADLSYTTVLDSADEDGDTRVSSAELEVLVRRHVQKQVEARFQRLDQNDDGRVTRNEVPRMDRARFARFDANGNGSFTLTELALVVHGQAAERCRVVFALLDVDGDGALSAADRESAQPTALGHAARSTASHPSVARDPASSRWPN